MLFKIIAFLAAAVPIVLFVRSVVLRRPSRMREGMREFRRQTDVALWACIGLIGCVVAFALGKLLWAWWTSL
jgi:multisubunit Na+/H+ antiporter MnhB subunit